MAAPDFLTAIKNPNVWLSQYLSLTVAVLDLAVSPLEYSIDEEMNELFEREPLVHSDNQTLDGTDLFEEERHFVIEERATLNLYGDQQLHVSSANADVLVNGKTKAVFACGGAAIKIENGSIELICPGDFKIKAGSFTFEGPQSLNPGLPDLPKSDFKLVEHYIQSR